MIKKLIGIFIAVGVIVVIVVTAINRDGFRSMELRDGIMNQNFPEPVATDEQPVTPAPGTVEVTDTVTVTVTDTLGAVRK